MMTRKPNEDDPDDLQQPTASMLNTSSYLQTIPEASEGLGGTGLELVEPRVSPVAEHAPASSGSIISSTRGVEAGVDGVDQSPDESLMVKKQHKKGRKKKESNFACISLVALVLVSMIAFSSCLYRKTDILDSSQHGLNNTESGEGPMSDQSTMTPFQGQIFDTLPPQTAPTELALDEVFFYLPEDVEDILQTASDSQDLMNPNTPQGKARKWLIEQNSMKLENAEQVLQRYSLLVLHFSTSNQNDRELDWIIPFDHECDGSWFQGGIVCVTSDNETSSDALVKSVFLANTNRTGNIPEELRFLTSLQELNLNSNALQGTIPSGLGELVNLYFLDVSTNQLSGSIHENWLTLPALKFLYLHENELTGSISTDLGLAEIPLSLQRFSTYQNQLQGPLPEWIGRLPNLWELKLNENLFTGSISVLAECRSLITVDLSNNAFTGSIPSTLWNSQLLQLVFLHSNQLTGTLPELSQATSGNLRQVWLHDNKLKGALPPWLASVQSLEELSLGSNNLTGSLPDFWIQAESLSFLDLSFNQLTGTVPKSLLFHESLQYIYLDDNNLAGNLSVVHNEADYKAEFPLLVLWLHSNNFQGEIYSTFGSSWPNLLEFEIQNNPDLTGTFYCDQWPELQILHADCYSADVVAKCNCTCVVTCY